MHRLPVCVFVCVCVAQAAAGPECGKEGLLLLQTDFRTHAIEEPRPFLRIGRSMLSIDPKASADVFVRRFGARVLQEASEATNSLGFLSSNDPGCAEIVSIELPAVFDHQRIQFVKDSCKAGASLSSTVIQDSLLDWMAQLQPRSGHELYSVWTDDHDGYVPQSAVNIENLDDDVGGYFTWDFVLRGKVPGTVFSWDVPVPDTDATEDQNHNPDLCRLTELDKGYLEAGYYSGGWFKSTFSTLNASAAFNFVHYLLDAEHIKSSYPEDRTVWNERGCQHYTRWAHWNLTMADGSKKSWMMHFVESNTTVQRDHNIDPNEITSKVLEDRKLDGGIFDIWLYNSVVLEVADISSYREKLDALSEPYLERLMQNMPTVCALWTSIPGSLVALQLISRIGCNANSAVFAVSSSG